MDNPSLTNRCWYGKNPLRVTVDRNGRLNAKYNIFDDKAESIVFTSDRRANYGNGVEIIPYTDLTQVIATLYERKIQSLIVEGGATLLDSFIRQGLWDEMMTFTGDFMLGAGVKAPEIPDSTFTVSENLGSNIVKLRLRDAK
jgi:diaminohydroxyphosphoribosylaminopyrimidine deaminase/5-amino-6-(5-phosphoribosylamino)uracil reductase